MKSFELNQNGVILDLKLGIKMHSIILKYVVNWNVENARIGTKHGLVFAFWVSIGHR